MSLTDQRIADMPSHEEIIWHVERSDRLRVTVASRASYVLSADALVLAGMALSVQQLAGRHEALTVRLVALALVATVMISVATSVWAAMGALAPIGKRFEEAAVSRGLFGWMIVDLQAQSYSEFANCLKLHRTEADAKVELFVCIKQHAHRYRRLQVAIRALFSALTGFAVLVATAACAALL